MDLFLSNWQELSTVVSVLLISRTRADIIPPAFLTLTLAENPGSTYVLKGDDTNFTVSVNVPENPTEDELFFHVSAPGGQTWVSFGFGEQMRDALMFVAYPSQDGNNITIGARIGTGHFEPKVTPDVNIELLPGSSLTTEKYNINARCTNCRSWRLPSGDPANVDVSGTNEPMLYALGDDKNIVQSDSAGAPIKQHIAYGTFNIDLRAATGSGGVPSDTASEEGVTHNEESRDSRQSVFFHGLIMAACFVLLFPMGGVLIRLPFRIALWAHLIWQLFTVLLVLGGTGLGMYVTIKHQKHPNLDTAHQGLGFAVVALVTLVQPFLGLFHHHTYKKTAKPTKVGKVHTFFGPVVILLGIINGALGLNLAGNKDRLPAYFGFVIFIAVVCTLASWILRRKNLHTAAVTSVAASNFREGAAERQSAPKSGVTATVSEDVPLQKYSSRETTTKSAASPLQQTFKSEERNPPQKYRSDNRQPPQDFRVHDQRGPPPRSQDYNRPPPNFRQQDQYHNPPPQFGQHDQYHGPPQGFRPQDQYYPEQNQYHPQQNQYHGPPMNFGPQDHAPPQYVNYMPQNEHARTS